MDELLKLTIAGAEDCLELGLFNKILIDSGGSNNNMSTKELQERMLHFITTDYYAVFFDVDGVHIGYTLVTKKKTPMFIRHYLILPQYRRRGYGLKAFNQLLSFFQVDSIDLTVLCSNTVGQKFWQRCGLKPYEIKMHYRNVTR